MPHLVDTQAITVPVLGVTFLSNHFISPLYCSWQDLEAQQLLGKLQSTSREECCVALRSLVPLASDMTFAQEVISRDGLQKLSTIIENGDE